MGNPQNYELWSEGFSGTLRLKPAWDGWDRMILDLTRRGRPFNVLETACNPGKAGEIADSSTPIWDWFSARGECNLTTVSSQPETTSRAQKRFPKATVLEAEIPDLFMRLNQQNPGLLDHLDVLHLSGRLDAIETVTHVGLVLDRLPKGCLIAVDGCTPGEDPGPDYLLRLAMSKVLKVQPMSSGWMTVWKRP